MKHGQKAGEKDKQRNVRKEKRNEAKAELQRLRWGNDLINYEHMFPPTVTAIGVAWENDETISFSETNIVYCTQHILCSLWDPPF